MTDHLDRLSRRALHESRRRTTAKAKLLALAVVAALGLAFTAPAQASVPSIGKLVKAFASWRFPSKTEKRWRTIDIDIERHETPDGRVYTKAHVYKMRCHLDGPYTICGAYESRKIRRATLDYDALLTTASARIVTTTGEVMKVTWHSEDPVPAGVLTSDQMCGSGTGKGAAVIKFAEARGTLFGVRLRGSEPDETGLALGVESTECSF